MPLETIVCATLSTVLSLTEHPKAFQLFHPMGGVGAGPEASAKGKSGSPASVAASVAAEVPPCEEEEPEELEGAAPLF